MKTYTPSPYSPLNYICSALWVINKAPWLGAGRGKGRQESGMINCPDIGGRGLGLESASVTG